MSLTDKVIKNTYYHFLSQIINFLAPLFLTPFIIAHIGNTEFGIYAFIIGVAGIFGLFDLSISTSFFKFITEYYNQKKYNELNSVINTASLFYLAFSLVCITIAILLQGYFLSAINIPPELESKAIFTYYIGLAAFSIVNTFGIYNSVIISLQKMYITSLYGIILSVLNFITVAALLLLGYGLYGILCAHIFFISCSLAISMYYSFRLIPELRLGIKYFKLKTLKDMFNIGAQMQVSKLASFASDKYDEFLLAYFSVISNVTYYNIASRVARVGKIIPTQLFTQAAPVAAELNAKQKTGRLEELFEDTTKYLTFVSLPIFAFMFIFAEELIFVWVAPGYEISAHLLRIIGAGSVINLLLSAPGNSITPNIGKPKFSMYEGLIYLSINLILSYFLVKYYGIIGAAYGSTVSTVIAAIYVYRVSVKFFNRSYWKIISKNFVKPVIITALASALTYAIFHFTKGLFDLNSRYTTAIALVLLFLIFGVVYILPIVFTKYFGKKEFLILAKVILFFPPVRKYVLKRNSLKLSEPEIYKNELVSIFIVTYNRLEYLKKCLTSLLHSVKGINCEIIIWDNNSTDGTKGYLTSLKDERITIRLNDENIGTNAKHYAAEMCKGEFITGIDDDVIEFPEGWLLKMIEAYKNIPSIGYLSADVVQDEKTQGAKPPDENYYDFPYFNNKFILQSGPAGGWAFVISRKIYNKVGRFILAKGKIFTGEDGNYTMRVIEKGYRTGILKDVKVYHATDEANNMQYKSVYDAKMNDIHSSPPETILQKIKGYVRHYKYYYYRFISLLETEAHRQSGGKIF